MKALISVSDKTGIVEFAKELAAIGIEIISTGGTYKKLKEEGIKAIEISELTGFPECFSFFHSLEKHVPKVWPLLSFFGKSTASGKTGGRTQRPPSHASPAGMSVLIPSPSPRRFPAQFPSSA